MFKPVLGLRAIPMAGYGKRGFTWRDNIPSVAHVGQRWFPSMNYLGAPLLGRVVYVAQARIVVMRTLSSAPLKAPKQ